MAVVITVISFACISSSRVHVVIFFFNNNRTLLMSIIVGGFGFIRVPYEAGAGDVELGSLYSHKHNQFLDGSR